MNGNPIPLFINPTAARGRARRRLTTIERIFAEAGLSIDVRRSKARGDMERQVHAEIDLGAEKIIIAGGDGSVYESVNGIMTASRAGALGLIPTGTGNDFAKAAGISLDWEAATRLLVDRIVSDSAPRRIDVGRVNDRYFANGAGIGFDAKVSRIAEEITWPIGYFVYLVAVLRAIADGIITPVMKITAGELSWEGPLTLANISNGPWLGGMFHIAPMADNSDGLLELIVATPVTGLRILQLLPKLIGGTHLDEPEIFHVGVKFIKISAAAPVPSHLDGEVQPMQSSFDIEIIPGALSLI